MNFTIIQLLLFLAASIETNSDEAVLYAKIKNGDHKAFKTFFESHHKQLFHFLLNKGVSEDGAEDLIQQAFVYVWENRSKIDEHKSLRSYLFRMAYTRMLNLFRDEQKFDGQAEIPEIESHEYATDSSLNNHELNKLIEQAIAAMPEKRQNVFRLCFLEEFTYKEAAEFMDVSVKTVENHMALALKDLRASLSQVAEDFL